MDSCCEAGVADQSDPRRCVACEHAGTRVGLSTLKALLRPAALERLAPRDYYCCGSASCPVVYFGEDAVFRREDVLVPVFQKEAEGGRTICYCFEVTEDQIRREVEAAGFKLVSEGDFLRHPEDTRDFSVNRPTGPVDEFVLKFQKPN